MRMMDIPAGRYKAKGIAGSERYYPGNENKHDSVSVNLDIPSLQRTVTAYFSFAPTAAPYSIRKLQALGWRGTKPQELRNLSGIDTKEAEIEVRHETYMNEPRLKVEVVLPGVVTVANNDMGKNAFMSRIEAVYGQSKPGSIPPSALSSSKDDDDDGVPF